MYIDRSAVRCMSVRNELGVRSNGLNYLKSEPCACERTWSCVRTNTESPFRTDLSSIYKEKENWQKMYSASWRTIVVRHDAPSVHSEMYSASWRTIWCVTTHLVYIVICTVRHDAPWCVMTHLVQIGTIWFVWSVMTHLGASWRT